MQVRIFLTKRHFSYKHDMAGFKELMKLDMGYGRVALAFHQGVFDAARWFLDQT